jgi:hypothetical protein
MRQKAVRFLDTLYRHQGGGSAAEDARNVVFYHWTGESLFNTTIGLDIGDQPKLVRAAARSLLVGGASGVNDYFDSHTVPAQLRLLDVGAVAAIVGWS